MTSRLSRVKQLIDRYADGSQTEFARKLGKTQGQVSQWFMGVKPIGEKIAKDIEDAFGLPRGWLDQDDSLMDLPSHIARVGIRDEIFLPQFNTGGKMGNGLVLRDQPGVIKNWSVNDEWLRFNIPNCTSVKNLVIVTGFGDSMTGVYNSGDPLIVDTGVTTVEYDGVYFFRVANEGFIKRLQRVPSDGIRAISENKAYETWTIKPEMDFEVFGRVLKAWVGSNY